MRVPEFRYSTDRSRTCAIPQVPRNALVEAAVHAAAPARGQAGGVLGILAKAHHLAVPVGAGLVLLVHQVEQRRGRRHGGDGLQRRQRLGESKGEAHPEIK